MKHPLQLVRDHRKAIFSILFAATLLALLVMNILDTYLITDAAPNGIISFELAGSVEKARQILHSWDENARLYAAFSLGFDYLFMVLYSMTIALACIWAGGALTERGWPMSRLGVPLAWGLWLAALLDAVENLGLTRVLLVSNTSPWPTIAMWCAIPKFVLVFLGMVYAFFGLVGYFSNKFS